MRIYNKVALALTITTVMVAVPSYAMPLSPSFMKVNFPQSGGSAQSYRLINFNGTNLTGIDLSGVNLGEQDFSGAKMNGVSFSHSFLKGADFTATNLEGASFYECDLREANFQDADVAETDFRGADLSTAKNLTQQQLNSAIYNDDTTLPQGLGKASTAPN